jgi:hypothetical protein
MEIIHEMVARDGLTTTFVQVIACPEGGILVCVKGAEDELLGQLHLKQNRHGYHVCLQAGGQKQRVPFIALSNEGERLGDILPGYRSLLSGRTCGILARREMRELPVAEFLERLGHAVAHDAFRLGPTWRGSNWPETLYPISRGIGPKTIQELAKVFLHEEILENASG